MRISATIITWAVGYQQSGFFEVKLVAAQSTSDSGRRGSYWLHGKKQTGTRSRSLSCLTLGARPGGGLGALQGGRAAHLDLSADVVVEADMRLLDSRRRSRGDID